MTAPDRRHWLRAAAERLHAALGRPLARLPGSWQQGRFRNTIAAETEGAGFMGDPSARDVSFFDSRDALTAFLFLQDEPAAVDLCFVLGSPTVTSMRPAIDLYRAGLTPRILISGHGPRGTREPEWETHKAFALQHGVPEAAILLERRASNTLENFAFARPIVEQEIGWHNVKRVAIVGKPFHMRRALMTARKQWPARLRFIMLPSTDPIDMPADLWWQSPQGRRFVLSEIKAIGTYALQGDIGGY